MTYFPLYIFFPHRCNIATLLLFPWQMFKCSTVFSPTSSNNFPCGYFPELNNLSIFKSRVTHNLHFLPPLTVKKKYSKTLHTYLLTQQNLIVNIYPCLIKIPVWQKIAHLFYCMVLKIYILQHSCMCMIKIMVFKVCYIYVRKVFNTSNRALSSGDIGINTE